MKRKAGFKKIAVNDLACVILAAGEGTRMNSDMPKVLHKIYKKPLIDYVLKTVKDLKIKPIISVIGYKSELAAAHLKGRSEIVKQEKRLGTADALKQAAKRLHGFKGDILTLCGDIPLIKPETLARVINLHRNSKASCTILTSILKNPTGYGRILRSDGEKIIKIIEEKDASLYEKVIEEINTGIYCFKSNDLFSSLKEIKPNNIKGEYYLTDVVELLVKKGLKVESIEAESGDEVLGINSRQDLTKAHKIMRQRIQHRIMEMGVTIIDPETVHIDADVEIGRDTVIEPFVRIEGNVKIGRNCLIGPFVHIRPGTVIKNKVKLGNFVEIVRSKVDSGTKINHHAYIGDTEVGKDVNIGAGTVTANYDGKNKNKTVIKDEVFIGSGTILVAPVKVGKGAVTGANSLVTKGEVKKNTVVVGVPARILKKVDKKIRGKR